MTFAWIVSGVIFLFLSVVAYEAAGENYDSGEFIIYETAAFAAGFWAWWHFSRRERIRNRLKKAPFPQEWENILIQNITFYNALNDDQKKRFQHEIKCFIAEKRITGIKTEIDDTDRILVAASAVIPIFGFPEWEYNNLKEVLLYPGTFRPNFSVEGKKDKNVLGMVGSGYMNGMMILSQPDLRNGFANPADKMNVGIHEFVHLLDKEDGTIDGMPNVLMDKPFARPWLEMMADEMRDIRKGKSEINPYGAMAKEEFFAVASEYFFERPDILQEKHPELYKLLRRIFRQDTKSRLARLLKNPFRFKKGPIGRNSPCPCGSGLKYKKCCSKN